MQVADILWFQLVLAISESSKWLRMAFGNDILISHEVVILISEENDMLQVGEPAVLLWISSESIQGVDQAAPTNGWDGEYQLTTGVLDGIEDFRSCVCIVDDHQDGADPRSGEKQGDILFTVAGHHSYPVALQHIECEKTESESVALLLEIAICPSCACPWTDQTLSVVIL